MRSSRTAMKSSPRSPQLEKAHAQQRRPNTAINKWITKLNIWSPLKKKKNSHLETVRWSPISNRKAVIYSRKAKAQQFSFLFFAFPFLTSLLLYLVLGGAMAYGLTKFGTHSLNWRYPSLEEGPGEKAMAPEVQKAQRKLPSNVLAFFFFWSSLPVGWLFFF